MNIMDNEIIVMKCQGFFIKQDDSGYFWENGPESGGYFDTVEEARADIADYNVSFIDDDIPDDTPSLTAPWWEAR